jgi:hypothetical protein
MTPDELEPDNQGTVPDIFSSICMSNEQVCRSLAPERFLCSYLIASHCIALHCIALHCMLAARGIVSQTFQIRLIIDLSLTYLFIY